MQKIDVPIHSSFWGQYERLHLITFVPINSFATKIIIKRSCVLSVSLKFFSAELQNQFTKKWICDFIS